MSQQLADRNLLFGILALQMNFIGRDTLVAAMSAWVLAKHKPLGQVLLEQGQLSDEQVQALDAVLVQHLKVHSDDPQESLESLTASYAASSALAEVVDDELQTSLGRVHSSTLSEGISEGIEVGHGADGARYRILRPHLSGGLGQVLVALDTELQREVALKEIKPDLANDPASRKRFVLEAQITGGLEHPGIVPVYGLGVYPDGRPFYAMKFIRGDSLKEAIDRFHGQQSADCADSTDCKPNESVKSAKSADRYSSLEFRQLLRRFVDVCNAVAYAHSRGVLHRDLKPANIMLGKFGETLLVDWGLAKTGIRSGSNGDLELEETVEPTLRPASGDGQATQAGMALGTPAYMSPEQAAGRLDQLGPASDIYSLGATLYVLLTGKKPFQGSTAVDIVSQVRLGKFMPPREARPGTPAALDAICQKAMALEPAARYATALGLAADVEQWLAGEPVQAYPEPLTARTARWARTHQTAVVAAGVFLISAVAALAVSTFLIWREQDKTERQKEIAQEQKAIAEDNFELVRNFAVDAMTIIESSEAELAAVPLLHRARKQVLITASKTLRRELEDDAGNATVRARAAQAFRYTANVHRLGDETGLAEPLYGESVRLYQGLAEEFPTEPNYRVKLSETYRDQAKLQSNLGRLREADALLAKSIEELNALAAQGVSAKAITRPLATALLSQGANQYKRGLLVEAGELAERSASMFEKLDRLFPGEGSHPYDKVLLAAAVNLKAIVKRESGQTDAAVALHTEATDYLEDLRKNRRQGLNNNDVAHFLAACRLAQCRTWVKRPLSWAGADINLGGTITQWSDLAKRFPEVSMYRDSLGEAHRVRGEIRAGWAPVAEQALLQYTVTFLGSSPFQILALAPRALRWAPLDRSALALANLEEARRLLEQRVRENPDLPGPRGELGRTYLALSRLPANKAERAQWLDKAKSTLHTALEQSPDDAENKQAVELVGKELAQR
jgi:serine/threonine-protein kinase